ESQHATRADKTPGSLPADTAPQSLRGAVAGDLAFLDHGAGSGRLRDYEDEGVGCQRKAQGGAVASAEPLPHGPFLGKREQAAGGKYPVAAHDDRPVMKRRVGIEDRLQDLGRDLAIDADACRRIVLDADVALEGDESARPLGAQPLRRSDRLGAGLAVLRSAEPRDRTA